MNNTIYYIISQLIFKNKITIEEVNGNEEKIVDIVNKSQVEGLKIFVELLLKKENGFLSSAEEIANDYIVKEIKKINN